MATKHDLESPLLADPVDPSEPAAPATEEGGIGSRPVEVVALSGEWSAVESSGSDRFETLDIHEQRRTRYAKMAREEQRLQACQQWSKAAREVPRRNATTWSPPGTGRRHAVDAEFEIGLVKVLVFFLLDTWMNTLVLIYVAAAGEFANALCLLPSQLLVIYIQSYLALCDSELEKRRSWIKASDWRCLSFCYDALIVIVCGGVCAYTMLIIERVALEGVPEKASRTPKGGPFQSVDWMFSKRSFIWGDVGSFDCLIRFMTGAPRVVCLLHMLQWKHISFRFWLFFSTLTLTVASMIQAIVLFDFKASAFIRREYNANYWWFRVYHWSSRLLELMLRAPLLVCFARSVKRELGLPAAVAALLLDYAISAIALSVVSGASVKAFVLSLPLYLVDICRYVDEPGLVLPARQLSNFIAGQRALLLVVTAGLMFLCRERWEADDRALVTCTAAALGFRLLLRRSPASFAPLDLHEAAKQGDVQALSQLLTEGYDTSRRQCTRLRETPLHVALAHGQLSCAQLLVDDGADPHIPDAMGENPLHYACRLGDPTIAMQLLLPLPEVGEDYAVRNVAQRNADGKSPAEVLPASAPMGLRERLRDLERQELRQYTMSGQLKPLVNRCDAEELATLFGLEWDRHEYSKMPADVEKGRHTGLVSFLFSRSVGDQLARVLDGLRQEQDGFHIMSLKPVRALGAGGFGSVIKVVDKRTQKFYAMKLQAKDRATKYAVREAQALHASDHAFIVGLVHIFQTSAHYCIVMELCAENLNDRILRSGREGLAPTSAAKYTACIALALEYLHGQEIVFRDLKPENVLVTEASSSHQEGVAKLADFGLACSMHQEEERPKHGIDLTFGGIPTPLAGTPAFMAAESFLRCATPVDLSAAEARLARARRLASRDWFGLGCCLLLMLLGETGGRKATAAGREVLLPFEGQALSNALRRASEARRAPEDALRLTAQLCAPLEDRAGLQEINACAWLAPALVAMKREADAFETSRSPGGWRSRRGRNQL